ncbi:hypothetical protein VV11_012100 [Trichodesmium erythraeum 21-75]|nr:hypothetical protein [Trichodesmium erythraeum 21-75]
MSIINPPNAGGYHGNRTASRLGSSNYQSKNNATYKKMKGLTLSKSKSGLIRLQKRLIESGQLGTYTACSIINPGVIYKNNEFLLLCRAEGNEQVWFGNFLADQAIPLWCTLDHDLNIKNSFPLSSQEIPPQSRPEDWRLFEYQGQLYANHSVYTILDRKQWIIRSRLGISKINIQKKTLELCWLLEPPFEAFPEEKNWSFFVHEGCLMCIYCFDPYIILEIDLKQGRVYKILETSFAYQWHEKGQFIRNSTNPVSWDNDHLIMFVHDFLDLNNDQRNRYYMQYGILISKNTLLPTHVIPRPLVMGGDESGRHPGVHYTSSLVNKKEGLYSFYGQGDSHTGVVLFNKDKLTQLFEQYSLTNIRT